MGLSLRWGDDVARMHFPLPQGEMEVGRGLKIAVRGINGGYRLSMNYRFQNRFDHPPKRGNQTPGKPNRDKGKTQEECRGLAH